MRIRWFAPLLEKPLGTTQFVRKIFPDAQFRLVHQTIHPTKIVRTIQFELNGQVIARGRSEVDVLPTAPQALGAIRTGKLPLGIIAQRFKVKRSRMHTTTRTRSFKMTGDIHAKIWERFYLARAK
ncbi:MAG: hypothetical protein HY393_04140 [Candidatus Diapherotrites archaeon]|nr:hypothetical protein [Candidatus Diapherotrites archaeon]